MFNRTKKPEPQEKPEIKQSPTSHFYRNSGALVGYVLFSIPGALAGGYIGNRKDIADANGQTSTSLFNRSQIEMSQDAEDVVERMRELR